MTVITLITFKPSCKSSRAFGSRNKAVMESSRVAEIRCGITFKGARKGNIIAKYPDFLVYSFSRTHESLRSSRANTFFFDSSHSQTICVCPQAFFIFVTSLVCRTLTDSLANKFYCIKSSEACMRPETLRLQEQSHVAIMSNIRIRSTGVLRVVLRPGRPRTHMHRAILVLSWKTHMDFWMLFFF
jgi:hypothetical protein